LEEKTRCESFVTTATAKYQEQSKYWQEL